MAKYFRTGSGFYVETNSPEHWSDATPITRREYLEGTVAESTARLLSQVKPGDTVFTILRKVSASGMSRNVSAFIVREGEPVNITHDVARVLGWRLTDNGIRVDGCGMDAGFHLVYSLGSRLWPNGTPEPHGSRNGEPDTSGGYALKQRWF